MRVDYYHTGNDKEERFSLDRIVDRAAAVAGQRVRSRSTTRIAASISSKWWTAASGRMLYSRGFRVDLRRVGNDSRGADRSTARFRIAPLPGRRQRRRRSSSRSGIPRTPFRRSGRSPSIRPTSSSSVARGCRPPGSLIKIHEAGDPAEKLDLLCARRRLHRCRARQVRTRRPASGRRALFQVSPFKERQQDINVWGLVPAAVRVRNLAAVAGHSSPLAARRDIRRLRIGALRPDVREPRVSRYRIERALRRGRDPDQFAQPTAAAGFTGCTAPWLPTAHGRRMCSSTSSGTTSPAWPTSTTPRTWPTFPRPIDRSPGSPM